MKIIVIDEFENKEISTSVNNELDLPRNNMIIDSYNQGREDRQKELYNLVMTKLFYIPEEWHEMDEVKVVIEMIRNTLKC